MRRPHLVRGNHTLELPSDCIWYDTETDQEQVSPDTVEHRLRFGWAAHRRRLKGGQWSSPDWLLFESPGAFWQWVVSKLHGKCKLYLFSHNQGFDLPVVGAFTELPELGFELIKAVIDCPPVILRWRRGKQSIEALDTLNIWRLPLADIGKRVGVRKLKMPGPGASRARWLAYGRRDVRVIMRAVLEWFGFITELRLGGFAPTLAGQSMRAFRHRFMSAEILIDCDTNALELSRESYLGGKCECYRIGYVAGPINRLDVNSMYPAVMRDNHFPVKLSSTTRHASCADLAEWLSWGCVVARVELHTDEPAYPVVHEGRLVFPVGRFVTTLASPELELALRSGHITRIERAAVYERAVIFTAFVSELWDLRRAAQVRGDALTAWLLKIFMNAHYGKWGQRGRRYQEAGRVEHTDARAWLEWDEDTQQELKHRTLGGLHQVWVDDAESYNSMPAIAAHVTSYARRRLWELQCRAGRGNVVYCDTDSLDATNEGMDRLRGDIQPDRLGALKVESVQPWMVYFGPKDYKGPSQAKTKGVRRRATWYDESTVIQDQWSTLVGLVRMGDVSAPRTSVVSKHLERRYMKGTVQADGRVLPLILE